MTVITPSDSILLVANNYNLRLKGGEKVNKELIGKRLIELRGSRTQSEIASAIGVSQSAYAMYESGERIPRDEVKIRIANFHKKSVNSIFYAN